MRQKVIGNCAVTRVLVIFALGLLMVVALSTARAGTTEQVSVASDGTHGNDHSWYPAISADGRFVAFESYAGNLVDGDTNGWANVFVRDRQTGQTQRVSVASDGTQGNDDSSAPSISADGRFVAFDSLAGNLVADGTNGYWHVFVHDRDTGQTTRVSVAFDGAQGDDDSFYSSISGDGRFVAFESYATNLVADGSNGYLDVFVHDRQTGQTERVGIAFDGTQGDEESGWPSISADGRFVAFESYAGNLVAEDTNGDPDVFVHDRQTGQSARVSIASDGMQGNAASGFPSISADGRSVAFFSLADNLVDGDTNEWEDVFVHDRQTGETTRSSVASDGAQGNDYSVFPSISADGRFVAFFSLADNLVDGDTNGWEDVFVHDRQAGETTRVSVASDGAQGNDASFYPAISADGRFVAFESPATNLVAGDTNGYDDVFVHDRGAAITFTISGSGTGTVDLSPPGGVYDFGTTVTLAPQPSPGSIFDHWEGDLTGSANPATILMDANKNVVVHFIYPQLIVLSAPIVDVAVTGTRAGQTPYTADCDLHEAVSLTAPESVFVGGKTYYFAYWSVNNQAVPPDVDRPFNKVEVTMDDRRTAVAQYDWRLPGDYNDDCIVNILDLLYVRNRLQTKCSE